MYMNEDKYYDNLLNEHLNSMTDEVNVITNNISDLSINDLFECDFSAKVTINTLGSLELELELEMENGDLYKYECDFHDDNITNFIHLCRSVVRSYDFAIKMEQIEIEEERTRIKSRAA